MVGPNKGPRRARRTSGVCIARGVQLPSPEGASRGPRVVRRMSGRPAILRTAGRTGVKVARLIGHVPPPLHY